ncbi:hypothetical protein Dsin_015735 [Dipteronia sinensis]|uniref:DUF4283 domain-containing protein n=1 Tax=Dipteronia sinensis TaxID=43782 RepID=A0AAE0ABV2_9ROSI|nr:hypothetical protein Dsin_015735 [Dipteronia sinensis]
MSMNKVNDKLPDCNISSKGARSAEDVHVENQARSDSLRKTMMNSFKSKLMDMYSQVIANEYLAVQKWKPNFVPGEEAIQCMPIWVRLSKLPMELVDVDLLWNIGGMLGNPCKDNCMKGVKDQHDDMLLHEESGNIAVKKDSPFGPWLLVSNRKYESRYGRKGNAIYGNARAGNGGKNYGGVFKNGDDFATKNTADGKNFGGIAGNKVGRNNNGNSGFYGSRTEHAGKNASKKGGGSRFEVLNEGMDETITDIDCQQNGRYEVKNGPKKKDVFSGITNQVSRHVKLGKPKKSIVQIEKKRDGKGKIHDVDSDSDEELEDPGVLQQLHKDVLAYVVLKAQFIHTNGTNNDAFKSQTSSADSPGNMNQKFISDNDASFEVVASMLKYAMAVVIE